MTRRRKCTVLAAAVAAAFAFTATPAAAAFGPDPTFSGDGALLIDRTNPEQGLGVATASGRTYVSFAAGNGRIWVGRLTPGGAPDPTWSGDGYVRTDLYENGTHGDVIVLPNGKVLVSGGGALGGLGVARLTSAGAPDTNFSGDGRAMVSPADVGQGEHLAVDSNGRIYVAGTRSRSSGPGDLRSDLALARFGAGGALDTNFSGDGVAYVHHDVVDSLADLAVDGNDRPVLMGSAWDSAFQLLGGKGLVARLRQNGALDGNFSGDGKATFSFGSGGSSVSMLGGGVDGQDRAFLGAVSMNGQVGAVRLTAQGALDANFSGDGRAYAPFNDAMSLDGAARVGSRLVFVGWSTGEDLWAGRLTSTGAADTGFGPNGELTFDASVHDLDEASMAAAGPSGSIVTVGTASSIATGTSVLVTRLAA